MLEVFDNTYSQLVAFFLAARLFGAVYYGVLSYLVPMVRAMMIGQMVIIIVPSLLWISSIHVAIPNRLILIWIAIALDYCGSMIIVFLVRGSSMISSRLATWANSSFEFYPAVNIEHKTARTDAFVTLIFGYSVIALLYQNSASFGVNAFFGKAILGLIQAFCLNALYFEIDGDSLWQHAIRRNVFSCRYTFVLFIYCHALNWPLN
jgi:low temperature requirement protein LtrA